MKNVKITSSCLILMAALFFFSLPAYSLTTTHYYDPLNRLAETVITDGTKTTTITYHYDAAGNMTSFITESDTLVTMQDFAGDFGRINCNTGCAGDLDGDGDVDGRDLRLFIGM